MVAYSDGMETRITRKRRWQSSPDKRTARASLDFSYAENTPPRKRRALQQPTSTNNSATDSESSYDDESMESFNTKSFYGGREKKHFPHSPRRRKAASKILARISTENVTSDKEWISLQKNQEILAEKGSDKACHSESESSESTGSSLSDLRPRTRRQSLGNVLSNTSKQTVKSPLKAKSLSNNNSYSAATPANNGKKFFKHKSPASADKAVGSVIIRKGFDLKFIPKRSSTSKTLVKDAKKNTAPKTKVTKNFLPSSGKKPTYRPLQNVALKSSITASVLINDKSTDSTCSEDFSGSSSIGSVERTDARGDNSEGSLDLFSVGSDLASGCSTPKSENVSDLTTDRGSTCSGPSLRKKASFSTPTEPSPSPNNQKYFAIFNSKCSPKSSPSVQTLKTGTRSPARRSPRNISRVKYSQQDDEDQLILDAGQKKFGATQCEECGMVYTHADPTDETTHAKFHQSLMNALKFPGWKKERIVQEYPLDGSRVLMVNYDDPKYAIRKVEEINKIMGQELGFPDSALSVRVGYKAFLYISEEKKIEGCCLAEPVTEGYRVIADSQPSRSSQPGHRPWCCRSTPEPAAVGISRIWVYSQQRRKGVATKLLDSVRQWFEYGVFIEKDKMAFSDPTPDGKQLATRYTGTPTFLVYKYG